MHVATRSTKAMHLQHYPNYEIMMLPDYPNRGFGIPPGTIIDQ